MSEAAWKICLDGRIFCKESTKKKWDGEMDWIDLSEDRARDRIFSHVYMFCFHKPRELF